MFERNGVDFKTDFCTKIFSGIGNITRSAEFNFANDPEAAHIVLTELKCPLTLITWELCTDMKQPLVSFKYFHSFLSRPIPVSSVQSIKNTFIPIIGIL